MGRGSRRWFTIPLGIVVGLAVGLRITPIEGHHVKLGGLLLILAVVVVATPVVTLIVAFVTFTPITIHELGHYLAGRSVGFRFSMAVVGPCGLREEGKRAVFFRARPALLGGYVAMVPPDDRDIPRRFARFILGGPVASLAWVALLLVVWWASGVPMGLDLGRGAGSVALWQLAFLYSVGAALLMLPGTLLPFRIKSLGGLPTDMMRLIVLRRGGDEARATFAVLELQRLLLGGVRAEDLPTKLLEDAERTPDEDVQRLAALQFRWAAELVRDPSAAEEAAAKIADLTAKLGNKMPKVWLDTVALIQAEQATFVRRDPDAAEGFLFGVEASAPTQRLTKATVEAAVSAIQESNELLDRIEAAETLIDEVSRKTRVNLDFERNWLTAMRAGWPREDRPDAPPAIRSTESA